MTARASGLFKRWLVILLLLIAAGAALFSYLVETSGVTPRALAPYAVHRTSGHNPLIVNAGEWLGKTLMLLDRGQQPYVQNALNVDAWLTSGASARNRNIVLVFSSRQATMAIQHARPGDVITFMPGHYRFFGKGIDVNRAGLKTDGITVRAEQPDTVFLEFAMQEGFRVSAPYWTFENLNILGVCSDHSSCEHAFHVTGKATNFTARNNRIVDFNAHFKINSVGVDMPDEGLLEGNSLSNSTVRETTNPVTMIDLVAASGWIVRNNLIRDFIKGRGDHISYGAYAKGAGSGNRFEQNIVLCEQGLRGFPGQRVGLSLGGGGTGKMFCRDQSCITEQDGGIIQSNLITSCSDDGIYINRSATSKILHNTLLDTGGIVVRFEESSADVEGNLVDGKIRRRDGGVLRVVDNLETSMTKLYLGLHPLRDLFVNVGKLDFSWSGEPPRRASTRSEVMDLCGAERGNQPTYGAFENFTTCLSPRVPKVN